MGNITCCKCHKTIDTMDISVCPRCGSIMCSDCAKGNGQLCQNCYEPMNFLS